MTGCTGFLQLVELLGWTFRASSPHAFSPDALHIGVAHDDTLNSKSNSSMAMPLRRRSGLASCRGSSMVRNGLSRMSMWGLTRPDTRRCHSAKALRYDPQRNSRLGVESSPAFWSALAKSRGGLSPRGWMNPRSHELADDDEDTWGMPCGGRLASIPCVLIASAVCHVEKGSSS